MSDSPTSTHMGTNASDAVEELRVLWFTLKRGWRQIALASVICLTLAALVLAASTRVYQATARLLIVQNGGRPLNVTNTSAESSRESDDYIPTHAVIVRSPLVIRNAIQAVGPANLPTLAGADDPIRAAISNL